MSLKHHTMSHEDVKPYQCEKCERVFAQQESLKRHMMVHEGIKPHECDQCDKVSLIAVNIGVNYWFWQLKYILFLIIKHATYTPLRTGRTR